MASDDEGHPASSPAAPAECAHQAAVSSIDLPDENTLRIMVSTDNHLGYCEKDPIRGLDSFAAFEEVMRLARQHQCDMVLLAGDLFHENKPSRRTLHKTMDIVRRYCMGPMPVQLQIVSDQSMNFRSAPNGTVNYEDEYYSVDLPIFSIHGNHDDPTRDGGTEMLAALDLLAVSNLVNYFGRQDEVDKVEVSPVLLRKGSTKVALYGMGSMRDERLNRMWQGKKVRFLRPEVGGDGHDDDDHDDDEEENESGGWFNIFALHQNRDSGRGSKNCVHESMIPEWMDLVVWGHEHECRIDANESIVGTFRITQPGSSVATSLTVGEARRKQVGILDVRGCQFRLRPIPLSQVRPFATGEDALRDHEAQHAGDGEGLDPEDPDVDEAVGELLAEKVTNLIRDAREDARHLAEDAEEAARSAREVREGGFAESGLIEDAALSAPPKFTLEKPDQVLVRLKVEHTGFSTLNNQRFGSRFVGEVANPSDILLFHRRRQTETVKDGGKSGSKKSRSALNQPMPPEELAEINVEDLVTENLANTDKKLELLDEQRLGVALDEFVSKEQRAAIADTVSEILRKQQKKLQKRGESRGDEDGSNPAKVTTATAALDICRADAEKARALAAADKSENPSSKRKRASEAEEDEGGGGRNSSDASMKENVDDSDDEEEEEARPAAKKSRKKAPASKPSAASSRKTKVGKGRKRVASDSDSDSEIEVVGSSQASKKASRAPARPSRRAAASSRTKGRYNYDDNDEEDEIAVDSDSDGDVEVVGSSQPANRTSRAPKKSVRRSAASSASSQTPSAGSKRQTSLSSSLSFTSVRRPKTNSSAASSRRKAKSKPAYDSDDSDDGQRGIGSSIGNLGGWGTANTESSQSRRGRR